MKIIILTGTDGTGKTTLKKELEKSTNYKYIVLDRFTDSIVYDKLYKRYDREKEILLFEYLLTRIADVYLIYLYCDEKEQLKRLKQKNEDEDIIKKIKKSRILYLDYLNKTNFNRVLKLDTSKHNIKKSIKLITNFVKNV